MERRRNLGARESEAPSNVNVAVRPPFCVRFLHDPSDAIDGFPTLELHPLSNEAALRALAAFSLSGQTFVVIDALRTFCGRGEHMSLALRQRFDEAGLSRSLVVDSTQLLELGRLPHRRMTVAAIAGPIDISDALALERAVVSGLAPLDAELRAEAILQCSPRRAVWSQFRDIHRARRFAGDAIASAVRSMIATDVTLERPADTVIRELLGLDSAGCTIRPRDITIEDDLVIVPLRSTRTGRVERSVAIDLITSRWHA